MLKDCQFLESAVVGRNDGRRSSWPEPLPSQEMSKVPREDLKRSDLNNTRKLIFAHIQEGKIAISPILSILITTASACRAYWVLDLLVAHIGIVDHFKTPAGYLDQCMPPRGMNSLRKWS